MNNTEYAELQNQLALQELEDERFYKNHKFVKNEEGLLECISLETGEVIAREETPLQKLKKLLIYAPDGKRLPRVWEYTKQWGEHICELIISGDTITQICKREGYPPYHAVARWRALNEDFGAAYDAARAMRAELLTDLIMEEIDHIPDKESVPGEKLRFDKLKHLAAVGDPDRFGNKVKHSGDSNQPIKFVIDTGFGREHERESENEGDRREGELYSEGERGYIEQGSEDSGLESRSGGAEGYRESDMEGDQGI